MKTFKELKHTKPFRFFVFILGISFIILTFFIILDPWPFLRFGYFGIFFFNMFGGPGMFLIPSLAKHFNIFLLAAISALGMGVNDSVNWVVGRSGDVILPKSQKIRDFEHIIQKYGTIGIFLWSLLPFPYDLVGIIAGYLGMQYLNYFIPTFLGKFVRFLVIGFVSVIIFGKVN